MLSHKMNHDLITFHEDHLALTALVLVLDEHLELVPVVKLANVDEQVGIVRADTRASWAVVALCWKHFTLDYLSMLIGCRFSFEATIIVIFDFVERSTDCLGFSFAD